MGKLYPALGGSWLAQNLAKWPGIFVQRALKEKRKATIPVQLRPPGRFSLPGPVARLQ